MIRILKHTILVLYLTTAVSILSAQLEFHGHVYPLARITFDQRYLNLPHRILSLEGEHSGRKVSLFFNTTLEYRLADNSAVLELQEAYAEYSNRLGIFRLGQHVISWGAADGNNPTDNVSPYDFYYLFMPGGDRKQGNLAASASLYLGNVNLELVLTPVFQPNRLPLNEPDFPIMPAIPFDMSLEQRPSRSLKNTEGGVRVRLPFGLMDFSVSYFDGYDRMFSPLFSQVPGEPAPVFTGIGYHRTQVFGGDLVTFLGEWAIRSEGAYFLTKDTNGDDPFIRNPYLQYVLQVDRADDRSNLVFQYLGTYITKIGDENIFNPLVGTISEEENERDNIPPKMGMPFGSIAQNALLATASYNFADQRYTIEGHMLYEFDHNGYMLGVKVATELEEAFDLELGFTYLDGDKDSRLSVIGEEFSHIHVGLKYSF